MAKLITGVGLILFSVIFTASQAAPDDNCEEFYFPFKTDLNFLQAMKPSLGKVYWDKKGESYHGTATMIDLKRRLLLTAAHVVSNKTEVYLYFPILRDKKVWPAKVIATLPAAIGEKEVNGAAWDNARDIALIQLNELPRNLKPAEIWLENLGLDEKVTFYGFPDGSGTPVGGDSMSQSIPQPKNSSIASPLPACTRDLREITINGDSGSPILNPRGLIIGILIQEQNEFKFARFVPTNCLKSFLIKNINKIDKDSGKNSLLTFASSSLGDAIIMLKPPPNESWITNLEFRSMMMFASSSSEQAKKLQQKHSCPVRPAIWHRGIGLDVYDQYVSALLSPKTVLYKKEQAEEIFSEASNLEAKGQIDIAKNLYQYSEKNYGDFIIASADKIQKWYVSESEANNDPMKVLLSQAYKGLSDAQSRQYSLTKNSELLNKAKTNAAYAVLLAPKKTLLKGSAYAALGVTAQKTGDHQTAIKAYTSAAKNGYGEKWVAGNYEDAFRRRDNVRVSKMAKDYTELGRYDELDRSAVLNIAQRYNINQASRY